MNERPSIVELICKPGLSCRVLFFQAAKYRRNDRELTRTLIGVAADYYSSSDEKHWLGPNQNRLRSWNCTAFDAANASFLKFLFCITYQDLLTEFGLIGWNVFEGWLGSYEQMMTFAYLQLISPELCAHKESQVLSFFFSNHFRFVIIICVINFKGYCIGNELICFLIICQHSVTDLEVFSLRRGPLPIGQFQNLRVRFNAHHHAVTISFNNYN